MFAIFFAMDHKCPLVSPKFGLGVWLGTSCNPPPCLQAQLECTDVEKRPSGENVILFKGMPLLQYSRPVAYTRKQSQTLFRLLFLMSKKQAHELQNGSLGDPKITKKTRKMRSGLECGKD